MGTSRWAPGTGASTAYERRKDPQKGQGPGQYQKGSVQLEGRDSMEGHLEKERGGGSTWHRAGLREPKRTEGRGRWRQAGSGCWWQRLSR